MTPSGQRHAASSAGPPGSVDRAPRNYVAFQLRHAGAREQLFAEGAIKKLFQASGGIPRRINQLALHVLIQGAVLGIDTITTEFMAQQLQNHPLYDPSSGP